MTEKLKTDFDEICKVTIIHFFKEFGFKRKTLHFANKLTTSPNVSMSRKANGIHTRTA